MDITSVFGTAISGSNPDECTSLLHNTQFHMKQIPKEIVEIILLLKSSGFEAQIVGGSVRDLLLGKPPKDWDINTNARPEEILALFPDSFYENEFGTVGVKVRNQAEDGTGVTHETVEVVEVTPYRREGNYKDGRRPEAVTFDATLSEDLQRRDFTVNAMAFDPTSNTLFALSLENTVLCHTLKDNEFSLKDNLKDILFYKTLSIKDMSDKLIRAVGNPSKRFEEDYLRMLRAVRLSCQLGFSIESETQAAIIQFCQSIASVSRERVRDELVKILLTETPMVGILTLEYSGLLLEIAPELRLGIGMKQTANHKYDVYGHLLRTMQHAADKGYSLDLRLAGLFHDIAKPHTARVNKKTGWNSFHGHEVVGEKVSREILERLKFPQETVSRVTNLIRWHMFNSDPDQVTMSAVRRMIINVGRDNIWDLMNLRFCDRIGSGRPMEEPHRLRRYFAMIEEALTQPTDLKMLKIDGKKVIEVTHETPGPRIGLILNALMGEVLEDPKLNNEEDLVSRVTEISKLSREELTALSAKGKQEQLDMTEAKKRRIKKHFKV